MLHLVQQAGQVAPWWKRWRPAFCSSGEDLKLGLEWLGGDLEGFKKERDKIPFNFPLERTSPFRGCVKWCGPGENQG